MIELTQEWRSTHPGAAMGILIINDINFSDRPPQLEQKKMALETQLRERYQGQDRLFASSVEGASVIGRAITAILYVSPSGSGSNGKTLPTAYTTIQGALDVASTDADDCTLILISPHTTNYDINTTVDIVFLLKILIFSSFIEFFYNYSNRTGISSCASCSRRSEGLFFSSTSKPVAVSGSSNSIRAVNEIKSSVIHSFSVVP